MPYRLQMSTFPLSHLERPQKFGGFTFNFVMGLNGCSRECLFARNKSAVSACEGAAMASDSTDSATPHITVFIKPKLVIVDCSVLVFAQGRRKIHRTSLRHPPPGIGVCKGPHFVGGGRGGGGGGVGFAVRMQLIAVRV